MNVMILAAAAALNIPGPGGLSVSIDTVGPAPTYSVIVDSDTLVSPSPLGLVTDYADLATNLRAAGPVQIKDTVIDYTLDRIKKKTVNKRAVKATIPFVNPQGWRMGIEFVLTDNDMAFRYTLPHQKDRGSVRVMREATGFAFPQQTTLFLTPQSDAMIGWKRTKPSYEEYYITDAPIDTKSQYGHGFTFPGLFRVGDKGWVLVTETGVNRDYCGSRLSDSDNGLFRLEFPMAEENNGNGTVEPAFALPGATPWRTVTAAKTLKPIVETTIPWDVVSPMYDASRQYDPARGTWSWILWQDDSINDRDLREYVRLAKEMGFEYTLVDNWWDKNLGRKGMEEFIKYSRTQGVEPIIWYSSSGYWNDIVQGPVNKMENPRIRRQEMQWLKDNGVKPVRGRPGGLFRRRQAGDHAPVRSHTDRCQRLRHHGDIPRLHHAPRLGAHVPQLHRFRGRACFREYDILAGILRPRGRVQLVASFHPQRRRIHGIWRNVPQQAHAPQR